MGTGYDTFYATTTISGGRSESAINTKKVKAEQQAPIATVPFIGEKATFSLRKGDTVTFNVQEEQHFLTVLFLTQQEAIIKIASTPKEFTLTIGQSVIVDVDDDSTKDIKVTLLGIEDSLVRINLVRVTTASPQQPTLSFPQEPAIEIEQPSLSSRILRVVTHPNTTKQKVLLWVVFIETVLVALALLALFHKPKHRK